MDILVRGHGIEILLDALKHNRLFLGSLKSQLDTKLPIEFGVGHANGKWMGQDSNLRCFCVTDLQSAALAARHTHP